MKVATIVWTPRALHRFYRLPPEHAEQIDRAVQRLVATGEGHTESIPDEPGRYRLNAGGLVAVFSFDASTGTLYVWRILRSR